MDLVRLRTLRELSKRRTMAAVADALLISASAVSQQISQLEEEAGVALVERRGRGVRLTLAGAQLVAHAERIFGILEEARTDLAELKKVVAGELRVSAFPSVAATLLPQAMKRLEREYPALDIVLAAMEPSEGLAALRAWQADIAIIDDITLKPDSTEGSIDTGFLYEDALFAMLPADHPLAGQDHVRLEALAGDKWALDVAAHGYSDVISDACRRAGFEPRINGYCNGLEVVMSLIEAGCSVSVMPGLRLRDVPDRVVVKPVVPPMKRRIFTATRRGENRNPAIAAFLGVLTEIVQISSQVAVS